MTYKKAIEQQIQKKNAKEYNYYKNWLIQQANSILYINDFIH
jgi:hypothetical protein